MIQTQQSRVPWRWVILLTTCTAIVSYIERCSGAALTFTIRKFTPDPALIALIGSANIAFNFLVAPYVAWKSDRIWTNWGRRRPFMIAGFGLMAVSVALVPFMPGLASLAALVVVWQFAMDMGYTGPWSPLLYETVPTQQRGRAVIIKNVITYPLRFLFNLVLIGQFDRVYHLRVGVGAVTVTGEMIIYGLAAILALLGMANLVFNVRETRPKHSLPPERFNLFRYAREVLTDKQFRPIYLLLVCGTFMTAGFGQLGPLLMTEQFGYTKQQFGNLATIDMLCSLCIVMPLTALIIDRFDRFHIFLTGLILSTLQPLAYWLFIKFVAPNQIPAPHWIVFFNLVGGLVDTVALLSLEPLFFDLVPREKMGTMNSGFLLIRGALSFVLVNAVGVWVKCYSMVFCPGKVDYTSGFLWIFLIGVIGVAGGLHFEIQRRRGKIVFHGSQAPPPVEIAVEE